MECSSTRIRFWCRKRIKQHFHSSGISISEFLTFHSAPTELDIFSCLLFYRYITSTKLNIFLNLYSTGISLLTELNIKTIPVIASPYGWSNLLTMWKIFMNEYSLYNWNLIQNRRSGISAWPVNVSFPTQRMKISQKYIKDCHAPYGLAMTVSIVFVSLMELLMKL